MTPVSTGTEVNRISPSLLTAIRRNTRGVAVLAANQGKLITPPWGLSDGLSPVPDRTRGNSGAHAGGRP